MRMDGILYFANLFKIRNLKKLSLLKGDERVFPVEKISEGVLNLTDGNKNNNAKRTPPSKPRKLGTPLES